MMAKGSHCIGQASQLFPLISIIIRILIYFLKNKKNKKTEKSVLLDS